jgi:hypothetical protein
MIYEQLERLRSARFLRKPEEVHTFESALSEIERQGGVMQSEAEDLYRVFEDSSAQQDVLWGLLHLIEHLDQDIWLPAFIAVLPEMMTKSSEWADTITARILNTERILPALEALLRSAPRSREAILPILEELAQDQTPRLQKLRQNATTLMEDLQSRP